MNYSITIELRYSRKVELICLESGSYLLRQVKHESYYVTVSQLKANVKSCKIGSKEISKLFRVKWYSIILWNIGKDKK